MPAKENSSTQRKVLTRPWWTSAMRTDCPGRYLSAPVTAFMRIGRLMLFLILKHGNVTPQDLQHSFDSTALRTNEQPISPPYSVHRGHTIESEVSSPSPLWI